MKLAKLAAALAAAFVILLSCPLLGQEEESGRHPLPPRGGQPVAPPDRPAAEISVGQPVPDPDVPDPTQPSRPSAEEAERRAQAAFRARLHAEIPGLRAAWHRWTAERSAKSIRRPAPRTRAPRPTTRPAPTPSLTAGQVEDIVKNLLDDFRKGLPNETALRGIVQEEIVQALGEYPTRQELEGCLAQVKKTIEKNGKATRLAIRETNGRALPFCLLIAVVVFAVIGLGATISGRRRKL